jgi:hypothetical protein
MSVNALELSITEESHQSVVVDKYRFDFIYNKLVDCWFLSVFENEELVYGSIKIISYINILDLLKIGTLIAFFDGDIKRDDLIKARLVYIAKDADEV